MIVSAFSGVTDLLLQTAIDASKSSEQYKDHLKQLEKRHIETTKDFAKLTIRSQPKSVTQCRALALKFSLS